jgi:hypothetical protein
MLKVALALEQARVEISFSVPCSKRKGSRLIRPGARVWMYFNGARGAETVRRDRNGAVPDDASNPS